MRWFRAKTRDERGTVLVLVSVAMVMLIGSTALAVDIGQLTDTNRDLQAVADVIALDAARALNGANVGSLLATSGNVSVAVQKSAARNGNFPVANLQVELGTKTGTSAFVPAPNSSIIPNAVRVTARDTVNYAFTPGSKLTSRKAVATEDARGGFTVGSYLVGIGDEHDTILNGIFGDSFGAHVLSYNGLVSANVTLEALGLNWPTGVLTPNEVLTTNATMGNFLLASAAVLRNKGGPGNLAAANILDAFRLDLDGTPHINLSDVIITDAGGGNAAATAQLNVLQMLTALAFIADGEHAITIPQAQLMIPGIGNVTVELDVIEPAKTYIGRVMGPNDTPISTAQAHVTITPQINISTTTGSTNACSFTGGLLNLLGVLVQCLLTGVAGKLIDLNLNASIPIELNAGGAEATLDAVNCNAPQSITVGLEPIPISLTSNLDLDFTAKIGTLSLGLVSVHATAGATAQSTVADQVFLYPSEFTPPHDPRSVGSTALGLAGLTNFQASSVFVANANITSATAVLTAAVLQLVNQTLGLLDSGLISPLNKLLGLSLGGADLSAIYHHCDGVRLAE